VLEHLQEGGLGCVCGVFAVAEDAKCRIQDRTLVALYKQLQGAPVAALAPLDEGKVIAAQK